MELWGGVECTVNRVGDRWRDQCALTGHNDRIADIDRFASLGLAAIRYPILWERIAPDAPDNCEWSWTDTRLARLRCHGLRVIGGLIHHGSGPAYTGLLDASFATGLAAHALSVAQRYPWIEDWTPVNEPMTTARFSALYGLWWPHQRDERAFWLAVLNQVDGIRLSMQAVRTVNPAARLIQTDDLGRTYATASLRDQAAFDNSRRWAAWDLLCGRVTPDTALFQRISQFGFEQRLRAIADHPCPPDVIGVNHYLTSDRFLDHRTHRYPSIPAGGNGRSRYVDIEAVRVLEPGPQGLEGAMTEAWQRYRTPLAITEVHNGCTREDQLRWTARAWDIATRLARNDVDVRAVTSWALLGSSGWNTLLTAEGQYEPGAFDVSGPAPRPTAIASLLRTIANKDDRHCVTAGQGWWDRPVRLLHDPVQRAEKLRNRMQPNGAVRQAAPILICGATGTLGQAFAAACRQRNLPYVLTTRDELDLTDATAIAHAIDRHRPWLVINAAGWVRVDDAEDNEAACFAVNASGAAALAAKCAAEDIATVSFSTDLVFDGSIGRACSERDPTAPISAYGRSKAAAEVQIGALPGRHLVIRTAAFFSPHDRHNFAWGVIDALRQRRPFRAACDQMVSPTYVPHLVDAVLDLAIDGEVGIWHLSNALATSWSDFAARIADACGMDRSLIEAVPSEELDLRAPRPGNAALISCRGQLLPPLDHAVQAFARDPAVMQMICEPVV